MVKNFVPDKNPKYYEEKTAKKCLKKQLWICVVLVIDDLRDNFDLLRLKLCLEHQLICLHEQKDFKINFMKHQIT